MTKPISKYLTTKLDQTITAKLKLNDYNPDDLDSISSYYVYKLQGSSQVGDSYNFKITFVSDEDISVEDIVDTNAGVVLKDEDNPLLRKEIYGKILSAKELAPVARKRLYEIEIVSPIHYLGLNKHYEIFQDKSAADIISLILNRYSSLLDLKIDIKVDPLSLSKRETATQYGMSDLDFIKMLCEEEGLSLICDYTDEIPYLITLCELNEHSRISSSECECSYNLSKTFKVSSYKEDYYDSARPSLDMLVEKGKQRTSQSMRDNEKTSQLRATLDKELLRDRLEVLDESLYKDLNRYAQIDALRAECEAFSIQGITQDISLSDSITTSLSDIKARKKTEAIIISATYEGFFPNALEQYISQDKDKHANYEVNFKAIPSDVIYKPSLSEVSLKKQTISGITTAIVANANNTPKDYANEIDVDDKGRIRVIFHFDKNRPTSCYIPLSNIYSGDGYGVQFIPRVNSEVIVSFINGDIDRPVITGAIHNGENRHPYNLPKEKTSSFIKTQTTPQYEDKEGYNELLFEDKQGQEQLNLRAQRDYNLNVLNDSNTHINNNAKTIVDNDSQLSIANNSQESVGNDKELNIVGNSTTTIEKEMLTSVKLDQETHVLKNSTTLIRRDQRSIVEKDVIQRIKGSTTKYIEKDAKEKYLENLYIQVDKSVGIHVTESYHLNAKSIKQKAKIIELEAQDGISLKCGGNVLTVDKSGIHLKAAVVDATSSNGGVTASSVVKPEIKKPLYNKLRVTKLTPSITKQNEITEILTYTAEVEKYENGVWAVTTDLTATQEAQINWVFIKNNDESDKDIISDNPTNDTIAVKGLEMSVTIESDNIYKYGHAFAFVVDANKENGYAVTELERMLEVVEIDENYNSEEEGECIAILNIDEPRAEELAKIRWNVNEKEVASYNGKEIITHNLKEEKVYEIPFKAYINGKPENAALASLFYDSIEAEELKLDEENNEDK